MLVSNSCYCAPSTTLGMRSFKRSAAEDLSSSESHSATTGAAESAASASNLPATAPLATQIIVIRYIMWRSYLHFMFNLLLYALSQLLGRWFYFLL